MADRRLVLWVDALLEVVAHPGNLKKKLFFVLSDGVHEIDWSIVEDLSLQLERLVALNKLEQQFNNFQAGSENRLVDWVQKNWANDWYGKTIYGVDPPDETL